MHPTTTRPSALGLDWTQLALPFGSESDEEDAGSVVALPDRRSPRDRDHAEVASGSTSLPPQAAQGTFDERADTRPSIRIHPRDPSSWAA